MWSHSGSGHSRYAAAPSGFVGSRARPLLASPARVPAVACGIDWAQDHHDVAIETSRGLLVAGLRAAGRTVYAINPLAVSGYRDLYRSSRAKSDAFDARLFKPTG